MLSFQFLKQNRLYSLKMAAPVWDYSAIHGQHKWGEHCKIGNHQSPIDIIHKNTTFDDHLEANPLKLEHHVPISMTALNKGVNISFSPETAGSGSLPEMSDGKFLLCRLYLPCSDKFSRNGTQGVTNKFAEHQIQ